jgi:hypothetical protein
MLNNQVDFDLLLLASSTIQSASILLLVITPCGQWHWSWHEVQQQYLVSIGSQKSGRRWATTIIQQFFFIARDTWLHRNHVCNTPGGQRDQDRDKETDPLIRGYYSDGIDQLHPGDHHLLIQKTCETVLGWPWDTKAKRLCLISAVNKFKERQPDLANYRLDEEE